MPPPHHDHHHDHHHHAHHHHHGEMEDWDDYDWEELPPHLKDAAGVLGWTKQLWDEDGKADTEDLDWGELSHEQRKAAEQFGYHPKLWDHGEGHKHHHPPHHHDHHHEHHHPDHKPDSTNKEEEEKKDGEEEDKEVTDGVENLNVKDEKEDSGKQDSGKQDSGSNSSNSNSKPTFKLSKSFGGDGGEAWDHGNNRHISKIIIRTNGHVVEGLEVTYANTTKTAGSTKGKGTTFELERGEFITSVTVRSNKLVQSIGFKTNKGKMLGPVGGKGWTKLNPLGNDTEGEEVKVNAPFKFQLCGLTGRAGSYIDQIAFRWGPIPNQGSNNQSK